MSGLLGALLGRALSDSARGSGPSARLARILQAVFGTVFFIAFGALLLGEGMVLGAASVAFLLLGLFAQFLGARHIRPALAGALVVIGLLGLVVTFFTVYPPR